VKLDLAIRELHESEDTLARSLLTMSERHRDEHEIHHVARDLTRWSYAHLGELAEEGRRYGLNLDGKPGGSGTPAPLSGPAGPRTDPGMALLADLRRLYRAAAGVSLDWELLGQGAQATKDRELLALTGRCHPQTIRQMQWANAMLKSLSPQILAS